MRDSLKHTPTCVTVKSEHENVGNPDSSLQTTSSFSVQFSSSCLCTLQIPERALIKSKDDVRLAQEFLRANIIQVANIKMQRRLGPRSVHDIGTCMDNTAEQWRLPARKLNVPQEPCIRCRDYKAVGGNKLVGLSLVF